jgi:CDP-diacylglycerol--glycerol-3-phosphate 3-phosphatidyltransferase
MLTTPPAYQSRSSSLDSLFGVLLQPIWPYLEAKRTRLWVRQLPNILTTIRLLFAIPVAIQLGNALRNDTGGWTISLWILVVIGLFASDGLDGTISSRLRITSAYGRIIDPLADKVLVISLLFVFVSVSDQLLPARLSLCLMLVICVRVGVDIILVTVTMIEAAKKCRPKAEKWGKRKFAMDGLVAVLLISGLWLSTSGFTRLGLWLIRFSIVVIAGAIYLGIRSTKSHLSNLNHNTAA